MTCSYGQELINAYSGKPFFLAVKHSLDNDNPRTRIQRFGVFIEELPPKAQLIIERFIDRWNVEIYRKEFWQLDTLTVFARITDDARKLFTELSIKFNDNDLLTMFSIIVLNYAYSAYDQPKMRKFMGITEKFPWVSTVALLSPIAATSYMASQTPATPLMTVGYGIANLGYLLFAAGMIQGTFLIFRLRKRWHVLSVALTAFIFGTILVNVGA